MQSGIGSAELIGALAAITRACGRQQSASFNPFVLVELSPKRLAITRASIDTVARRTIPFESGLTTAFTLPAVPLHDLLQVVSGADLNLDVEERTVRLRVGMFDTHLPKGRADDFLMPTIDRGSTCVKVDGRQFAQAGSRVAFAKSDNESQPRLHGIFLDARGDEVIVAATDGHRAAEARTQATVLRSLERIIVPARPIAELGNILRVDGVSLDLVAPDKMNWLRIESGDDYVQTQLIDGQYPKYSDVRPQDLAAQVEADKYRLILAVRGCGVFSSDTYRVRLIAAADRIVVVGESTELGTNRAELDAPIQPSGATAQCTINGKYLVEALEACPGATVLLEFGQPRKPLTVAPIRSAGFWAATSPILVDPD